MPPTLELPIGFLTDAEVQVRVRSEFVEMPGLRITLPQAIRLFGVEQPQCEYALATLVDAGELTFQDGMFCRSGCERTGPRLECRDTTSTALALVG